MHTSSLEDRFYYNKLSDTTLVLKCVEYLYRNTYYWKENSATRQIVNFIVWFILKNLLSFFSFFLSTGDFYYCKTMNLKDISSGIHILLNFETVFSCCNLFTVLTACFMVLPAKACCGCKFISEGKLCIIRLNHLLILIFAFSIFLLW